ncbi:MAG: HAD family hydrolase [Firmicutes bacterium]|nr:HAD family hydrolase [Bacillota bacterium]
MIGMYYPNYIFDLYGTLADIRTEENSPVLWRRTALWYREHGAGWEDKALRKRYQELCHEEQKYFADPLGEIELRHVFTALFAEKGVVANRNLVEETARFFRICSVKKLRLYPWVQPTFRRLRAAGSHLYLLSNAQACFTEGELVGLGLTDAFDGIVLSSDAGVKKPSPEIMRILLERFGLRTEECLMIGNDPAADIEMARGFGMDTLYLKTETSPADTDVRALKCLPDEDYSRLEGLLQCGRHV